MLLRRQSSEARWVFDDPSKPNYEVPVGDISRNEMEGWTFDDAGGSDIGTLTYTREDSSIGILGVPTTLVKILRQLRRCHHRHTGTLSRRDITTRGTAATRVWH